MYRNPLTILVAGLLAGCATAPLPDGSRIERLPSTEAVAPPTLTPDEARKLAQLNAQILAEQNAARAREEQLEAWRRANQQYYFDLHYGRVWPYGHWYGPRWGWRPRWSSGFGYWGVWP
ncbi:MAG: hypothetical protein N3D71_08485 [Burkholderiaceae bacterium]|nr:hypothetical protein [Burkholderiaceae bacterium]